MIFRLLSSLLSILEIFTTMAAKRVCKEESNWSNLPIELLELIVKRLNFKEMACFKAVCPSWKLAIRSYSSSLIPRLLISNTDQQQQDGESFPSKNRKKNKAENPLTETAYLVL